MNETYNTYEQIDSNGRCVGIQFDAEYAKQYLKKDVSDRFYNKRAPTDVLSSVHETGMDVEMLEKILMEDIEPKGWFIGEYITITAMEKFFESKIYHYPNRETTSPNASMAGADLIGTTKLKGKTVFLLGEVKTSSSTKSPLHVMYNLISELDGLSDVCGVRAKTAIRWMLLHKDEYGKSAIKEAYENYSRRKIAGVLVRDTDSNKNDIMPGYVKLLPKLPEDMFLLMVALYMPININEFMVA